MKISKTPLAILAGARTPFCKAFSTLTDVSAVDLGVHAVTAAVNSAATKHEGLTIRSVDEIVMGNVASPPDAANIARVIALKSGHPKDRIAHTVNRNCASGMESILAGWNAISTGRSDLVVAGGTESMSQIPMLFRPEAAKRWMALARSKTLVQKLKTILSFRPKHFKPVVGVQLGLTDPVSGLNMGETAEVLAKEFSISREEQDAFAVESHRKAAAAQEKCFLSGEIAEMEIVGQKANQTVGRDNGPRANQSMEQLKKLRPIFDSHGTVTAGNSCPLTDGAAALVLASAEIANQVEQPLGYITDFAIAGCDPHRMGLGPVYATAKLLRQTGLTMNDFDLIEINEAFAAQVIACQRAAESEKFARRELGMDRPLGTLDDKKMNIHGGAIALGHPVGTTGARLILTLLRALRATDGSQGLATLCVGGGQGVSMVVRTHLEAK